MKNLVPDWVIQLVWFAAGIFATGAFWYFMSVKDFIPTVISGISAVAFATIAAYLQKLNDRSIRYGIQRGKIAAFIREAHTLLSKLNEEPLPILALNQWVESTTQYLKTELDESFAVRFSDFSGMTFYGDGSEKSWFKNAIDGRIRRLNQFLSELLPI